MKQAVTRLGFIAALLLMLSGCSAMKDPALWTAMSQSNAGSQPQSSPYAPPVSNYAPPVVAPSPVQLNPELLLFGGPNHDVFLGCLNCSKYDTGSVWNKYGDFGSRYSDKSIWNRYGTYGSKYSDECPWNRYGQTPPVIVDRAGNFYGYFTANAYFPKRTTIKAMLQILDNYETIMDEC